ncbi:MAG: TonB family protein, partial [Maricaulaceae bacterium]
INTNSRRLARSNLLGRAPFYMGGFMNLAQRFGTGLVLSTGMTFGLGVMMAALIRTHFTAAPVMQASNFDINPVVMDEPPVIKRRRIEPLKKVEIPPATPRIETQVAAKVSEPIATVHAASLDWKPPRLARNDFSIAVSDTDLQPILRPAPSMPPRAERSGHCNMLFDVTAEGQPYNVQVKSCSQKLFERASVKAVAKWRYRPEVVNGQGVTRRGLQNKITFHLTDANGYIIPE